MADIRFKKISEESYESVSVYLDHVLRLTSELGEPAFIDYDGTRYFFTRVKNEEGYLYVCSYRKEDGIRVFGLDVSAKNPECVKLTDGITIYNDQSNHEKYPFVLKTNKINSDEEFLIRTVDSNNNDCLVYKQKHKDNGLDCEIEYSLKGHENNVSSYIKYIDTKYPRNIELGCDGKILKVINHRECEKYKYLEGQYVIPFIKIFGYEIADSRKLYGLEEILYNVRTHGFNSCVPKTLGTILTKTNEVENNMKVLAKVYDENIMKLY